MKILISFKKNKSVFLQVLHHSLVLSSITPLFLAQTLCTLVKKSPLKCKVLRFSSAQVHVNFETSQFLSKFCIISFLIVMTHNSSVNFKLIHFLLWIKGSYQSPNFETFVSALVKIYQVPPIIFQTTSPLFFKFFITYHCYER